MGRIRIGLPAVAQIRNRAAKYGDPSAAATPAAINAFSDELGKDVRTPIVDPPASAADAYPICGLTYLLVPEQGKDPKKQDMVKQFIQFILTDGQNTAGSLYDAKLPPNLADEGHKMKATRCWERSRPPRLLSRKVTEL